MCFIVSLEGWAATNGVGSLDSQVARNTVWLGDNLWLSQICGRKKVLKILVKCQFVAKKNLC